MGASMHNRKLIRPNLSEIRERFSPHRGAKFAEPNSAREVPGNGQPSRRRAVPPENTNAEAFYYLKQMNGQDADGGRAGQRRRAARPHRVVRPLLPQGPPPGRAQPARLQAHIKYLYKQEDE